MGDGAQGVGGGGGLLMDTEGPGFWEGEGFSHLLSPLREAVQTLPSLGLPALWSLPSKELSAGLMSGIFCYHGQPHADSFLPQAP